MFTTFTKKTGIFIALLALLSISFTSCKKDEHVVNVPANPNQTVLKELIFKIGAVYNGKHVVGNKITNVKIKINGFDWGTFDSQEMDQSLYEVKSWTKYDVAASKYAYFNVSIPTIRTSAEITANPKLSEILNSSNSLYPGAYLYTITSFDITDKEGNTKTVKTNRTGTFTVLENHRSVYLGTSSYNLN